MSKSSPLDIGIAYLNRSRSIKSFELDLKLVRRHFQAFIFRNKQRSTKRMPTDWEIKSFEHNDFIKALGAMEFSPFDIMDQA